MAMDCCCKILKFAFIFVNIIVTLIGVALVILAALGMTLGVQSLIASEDIKDATVFYYICVVLLVLGVLMSVIGFLGCCGACKENQCMLGTFIVFMVIGLALDITGGALMKKKKDEIEWNMVKSTRHIFSDLNNSNLAAISMQQLLKCCGVSNFKSWESFRGNFSETGCCKDEDKTCLSPWTLGIANDNAKTDMLYHPGCEQVTLYNLNKIFGHCALVVGMVGLVLALALAFSIGLCCAVRKNIFKSAYRT